MRYSDWFSDSLVLYAGAVLVGFSLNLPHPIMFGLGLGLMLMVIIYYLSRISR